MICAADQKTVLLFGSLHSVSGRTGVHFHTKSRITASRLHHQPAWEGHGEQEVKFIWLHMEHF